jgi:Cu-Zn family superoxide dismutase
MRPRPPAPAPARHAPLRAFAGGLCAAALFAGLTACATPPTPAKPAMHVPMAFATPTGPGASVGEIVVSDSPAGVQFKLDLHGLPPGAHGFHAHVNPSCAPTTAADGKITPAGGAGGHFDPDKTGAHMGPMGAGHRGDLPVITVAADGAATQTLTAPHLKTADLFAGRALMIQAGGDNYADAPAPLGGGGARLVCGVAPGAPMG